MTLIQTLPTRAHQVDVEDWAVAPTKVEVGVGWQLDSVPCLLTTAARVVVSFRV